MLQPQSIQHIFLKSTYIHKIFLTKQSIIFFHSSSFYFLINASQHDFFMFRFYCCSKLIVKNDRVMCNEWIQISTEIEPMMEWEVNKFPFWGFFLLIKNNCWKFLSSYIDDDDDNVTFEDIVSLLNLFVISYQSMELVGCRMKAWISVYVINSVLLYHPNHPLPHFTSLLSGKIRKGAWTFFIMVNIL